MKKLLKIFIFLTISIITVNVIDLAQAQTMSWRWEAIVYQAEFNSSQTIPLPWEISVGDKITGTFKIDYSDEGYIRDPDVKVYESQTIDNVTAQIDGVEVWMNMYTISNRINITDQPIFSPDQEQIDISRFGRGDPRFPNVAVDGGISLSNHPSKSGYNLIQDAEIPVSFELSDYESHKFGLFIGETDPEIRYNLSANLISLTPISVPTIDAILNFFDQSVSDGTLTGNGHGNSANNRLDTFKNKLQIASDSIDIGDIDGACFQLEWVLEKCDGIFPPPDFVQGDAVPELYDMIVAMMEELGCE